MKNEENATKNKIALNDFSSYHFFNDTSEVNENGEKLFKLVELITDDKKFPQKKANRIVGAIRVKEREKVS